MNLFKVNRRLYSIYDKLITSFVFSKQGKIRSLLSTNIQSNKRSLIKRRFIVLDEDYNTEWIPFLLDIKLNYSDYGIHAYIRSISYTVDIYENFRLPFLEESASVLMLEKQQFILKLFVKFLEEQNTSKASDELLAFNPITFNDKQKIANIENSHSRPNIDFEKELLDSNKDEKTIAYQMLDRNLHPDEAKIAYPTAIMFIDKVDPSKVDELKNLLDIISEEAVVIEKNKKELLKKFNDDRNLSHFKHRYIGAKNHFPAFIMVLVSRGFFIEKVKLTAGFFLICAREFGLWANEKDIKETLRGGTFQTTEIEECYNSRFLLFYKAFHHLK